MEYIEQTKKVNCKIENKPRLRNIYKWANTPILTNYEKTIEANKNTMVVLQNKAKEIAKKTPLTYPEAVGVLMEYTKQNINSIKDISVKEVLEFINKKNKKKIVVKPIKNKKSKNSFSKLRGQLRNALGRLDTEQRANNVLNQEVERLRGVLDIQQKQIAVLNSKLETEANRTASLTNSLMETKENKDWYYEQWIKDHSKIKEWKKIAKYTIAINVIGLIIIITKNLL